MILLIRSLFLSAQHADDVNRVLPLGVFTHPQAIWAPAELCFSRVRPFERASTAGSPTSLPSTSSPVLIHPSLLYCDFVQHIP